MFRKACCSHVYLTPGPSPHRSPAPHGKVLAPFTVSISLTPNHMHLLRWLCRHTTYQAAQRVGIAVVLGLGVPDGAESRAGSF